MLDSTSDKTPSTSWEERDILYFIRETVQYLAVHNDILSGPIHYHDHLEVISGETNDDKMLAIMCNTNVKNSATIRND